MMRALALICAGVALVITSASATDLALKPPPHLPNAKLTPGEANPVLTQEKVCDAGFRTGPFRVVPSSLKRRVYAAYGMANHKGACTGKAGCEVDHLVSLEIGGANTLANLWPQPYAGDWNARIKDRLENVLHKKVCAGELTLQEAQVEISTDWIASYKRHIGESK